VFLIHHGQTEFYRVFSATRRDPGIRDPQLTVTGRLQARNNCPGIAPSEHRTADHQPFARALETAGIIAGELKLPIAVEPLVAERFVLPCDIGSSLAELRTRWPDLVFDHLPDPWWPQLEETEAQISQRSVSFRCLIGSEAWSKIAVITHWGFIRALTGPKIHSGAVLRIDPTRLDQEPEMMLIPDAA
jgi:glucosyl-3-phosphoglycerate phosphatase